MIEQLLAYNTIVVLLGVSILGAGAGMVGSFAVLRKRALTGDAVAHAALPGVCVAFLILGQRNLTFMLLGALASGVLGIVIIAALCRWTRVREDAAIGIVLSVFPGLGFALSRMIQNMTTSGSKAGLESFILGKTAGMTRPDVYLILASALFCLAVVLILYKEFKVVAFDSGFARSLGWPIYWLDLLLMSLIAVAVVIGLPAVGIIMMAALLILPGAAARFWTDSLGWLLSIVIIIVACCVSVPGTWVWLRCLRWRLAPPSCCAFHWALRSAASCASSCRRLARRRIEAPAMLRTDLMERRPKS